MARKTPKYGNWVKNFGSSVKFASKDVLTELAPSIAGTTSGMAADVRELKQTIRKLRKDKRAIVNYIIGEDENVSKYAGEALKNLKHGLKTGDMYDPARSEKMLMKSMGLDDLMDGFDDGKFLIRLNLFDAELSKQLDSGYTNYLQDLNKKYGANFNLFNSDKEFDVLPNQYSDLEHRKIQYLEERYGREINEDDLVKFKIILNLKDFFSKNNIDQTNADPSKILTFNRLNENYVMFLLYDKRIVSCRNINKDIAHKDRYYKLTLMDSTKENSSKRFYSIKNEINLQNRIYNIHIAEGAFDIESVYLNIYDRKMNDNDIFIANNGKGFLFVLNYLESIGIMNANINIYSDSDVPLKFYKDKLRYNMLVKFNGLTVYYNKYNELDPEVKDFGVTSDKIILSDPIKINI
jgi:hypothetical protein